MLAQTTYPPPPPTTTTTPPPTSTASTGSPSVVPQYAMASVGLALVGAAVIAAIGRKKRFVGR